MTDILWEYTYRVVPNIKDSNYESNAQLFNLLQCFVASCSEYQR